MNEEVNFDSVYNKSNRLATAVFVVSNVISGDDDLKTKIKNLSLNIVSLSVCLKDLNFFEIKKVIADMEKKSLELMSLLDIASISGLISKMNGDILKKEFQSFVFELNKLSSDIELKKGVSVKDILVEQRKNQLMSINFELDKQKEVDEESLNSFRKNQMRDYTLGGGNNHKRKDSRRNTILDFIKGHSGASIKDIMPNVKGCSEKTIQRELIALIKEGKIRKEGERRWSRYSLV